MSERLRLLNPTELDAEQRELYAEITGGPRAAGPRHFDLTDADGHLRGPFNAMLLSPALGGALQELGSAVRYRTHLTDRTRELAILVVAHAWDSDFERHAHERVGAAAGLTPDELLALREGRDPKLTDLAEQAAWSFTYALASQRGALNEHQYDSARSALGERALFELSTLVGYYSALALQLRLFDVTARTP
ncbi:carboxymuconolactone decarboxylase family protein [Streptomyces xylophagus]|uniref:carboxymuconolactone decarboxylase family protein n=1 Tax=Streptomyces xylophagus TaxID=285514 RepID=UPI0005BD55DD|nr:carboxymuconolactone decarboxylase family protein [Streptomyces xylophagus]